MYILLDVVKRSPEGDSALIVASATPWTLIHALLAALRSTFDWQRPVISIPLWFSRLAGTILICAPVGDRVFDMEVHAPARRGKGYLDL